MLRDEDNIEESQHASASTTTVTLTHENEWVGNYVAKGGSELDGRSLYRKMISLKTNSIPLEVTATLREVAEQTTSQITHTNETDLFGAVIQQPEEKKIKSEVVKRPHGRPAVDWSTREKTKQEKKLFQLSLDIESKPAKENNQIGAISTAMIYASLPHSKIDGAVFKRKNGSLSLTILNDPDIGLPYGKVPRIITAFLCTEAIRHQSPEIELGKSISDFAKKLCLSPGGGDRGGLTRLKDQAKRLFTSHITLTGTSNTQFHWQNVNISDNGMLLWNPQDHNEKSSWDSKIILSDTFFTECIQHSVPIDLRVLHSLRSPLAIDIYIWMTYRFNSLNKSTYISWEQLKWQFGSNYASDEQGMSNFISNFKLQLRQVKAAYPDANYQTDKHKLTLNPSRPHVLPKVIK